MPVSHISLTASRRHALVASLLTAAGLRQAPLAAGKNKKRKKNSCKSKVARKVEETCGQQLGPCLNEGRLFCARSREPAACEAIMETCCGSMAQCDAQGYIDCMDAAFGGEEPV
jgi:hypothetical protein